MTRFKTVFFDLDGTLLDHFDAIHASHCYTRRHFGLSEPSMEEVHRAVGAGVNVAIERIFAHDHPELVSQAIGVYREYWDKHMLEGVRLLPGSRELLVALKAIKVQCAVLTNKHGPSSRIVCNHLGVSSLLDGIFGATDTPWLKPQIEFTSYALKALNASQSATCLIGDSIYDAQTGIIAGFPCYCVTTGTHSEQQLREAGATDVFPNMHAIAEKVFSIA